MSEPFHTYGGVPVTDTTTSPATAKVASGLRNRFCGCSRADSARDEARAACVLHGNTKEAEAYRAGMKDALNGFPLVEARPIRSEDRTKEK